MPDLSGRIMQLVHPDPVIDDVGVGIDQGCKRVANGTLVVVIDTFPGLHLLAWNVLLPSGTVAWVYEMELVAQETESQTPCKNFEGGV